MKNGKWKLNIGCHKGTVTSRDSVTEKYDSKQEAHDAIRKKVAFWARFGYRLWFAKIYDPEGNLVHNDNGFPYR